MFEFVNVIPGLLKGTLQGETDSALSGCEALQVSRLPASQAEVYSCQVCLECVYVQFAFLVFAACTDLISTYFVSTVAEPGVG